MAIGSHPQDKLEEGIQSVGQSESVLAIKPLISRPPRDGIRPVESKQCPRFTFRGCLGIAHTI